MKAFRFTFESSECLNCGVCVDVCPAHSLDMTRPQAPGPEPQDPVSGVPCAEQGWMTVSPVQIAKCTGCMVCAMECPLGIIHVETVDQEVFLAPPQGILVHETAYDPEHWQALSDFTRVSRKDRPVGDPWGPAYKWRPVQRSESWRVWRTWSGGADTHKPARNSTTLTKEE